MWSGVSERRRAGFTLVELLIVLVIIVVLAALVFPVLAGSRESARRAACTTNLRQLHSAFQMYASDNTGFLPPYQNRLGASYGEQEGGSTVPVPERTEDLLSTLQPYVKSDQLWFCPTDRFARTASEVGRVKHRYTSYATGAAWIFWLGGLETGKASEPLTIDGPASKTGKRLSPSLYVLLTDNLWGCDYTVSGPQPAPKYAEDMWPYSHSDRYLYLFFDGHVKSLSKRPPDCLP